MRNEKINRIRVMDAMVIALILMLSGVSNMCAGQEFVISHEYFFLSDIDPEMFDLVQIKVDDKLKKIKKNQPEYEILRNPKSLFEYIETFKDKNNIEFFLLSNGNTKYCFPHYDKNGVEYRFYQYAVDYTRHVNSMKSIASIYGYIDVDRASALLGIRFVRNSLAYGRFFKLYLEKTELTSEQSINYLFVAGDNKFSIDDSFFMKNFNKFLVSNSKIKEFEVLAERVNGYKLDYKYLDIQRATSISIKDSSNLVCGRFYPIDIKEVVSTEDLKPLIVFSIDGKDQSVSEKYILENATELDIVNQCKDFYNYIESAKQEYKYFNVFCKKTSTIFLNDTSLLYGKFAPIIDLKGWISPQYSQMVQVECESKQFDMLIPVETFKEYAYTLDMVGHEKNKYEQVVEQFENAKRDYIYYNFDDERILPIKVIGAKINEDYEIVVYIISVDSSEQYVVQYDFYKYAMTKEKYPEELKRIAKAQEEERRLIAKIQEEERRRIAQAQEEERKSTVFFTKNLKGYVYYRMTDFATYLSSKSNDFGVLLLSAGISGVSNDAFFMTEGYVFADNQKGAFMVDFDYDKNKVRMTNTSDMQGYLQVASLAADLKESTVFTYKISGNQLIMTGETTSNSGRKYHFSKTLIYNEKDHTLREGNVIYKRRQVE